MTTITFHDTGDFAAVRAAESWLSERGYSWGAMQQGAPSAIYKGRHLIGKWRNLSPGDRANADGQMTGDMRNGPVTITLKDGVALHLRRSDPCAGSRVRIQRTGAPSLPTIGTRLRPIRQYGSAGYTFEVVQHSTHYPDAYPDCPRVECSRFGWDGRHSYNDGLGNERGYIIDVEPTLIPGVWRQLRNYPSSADVIYWREVGQEKQQLDLFGGIEQ